MNQTKRERGVTVRTLASRGLRQVAAGVGVPGASVLGNALGSALGAGGNFGDTPGLH